MLTRNQLLGVMPGAAGIADHVLPALDAAMQRFDIASPARMAAFLSQLAHESSDLQRWTENLNYRWERLRQVFPKYFRTDAEAQPFDRKPERIANRVYGGRMGNGAEASGDGWRYRGRGPIQLTGKDNYRTCGTAIGVDLVSQPERLETPEVGCLAAAWFWASRGLNVLADAGDFVTITKRINGGLIGLEHRTAVWKRAKEVFGLAATAAATRTRRARGGARRVEIAEEPAQARRKKPAQPRATGKAKAGAKAGKARAAAPEKSARKATTPRVAATRKAAAKATAKRGTTRVGARKTAGTKAAKPRAARTKKAAKPVTIRVRAGKAAKTETRAITAAKTRKVVRKPAKPRVAAVAAARKAASGPDVPRAAPGREAATHARKSPGGHRDLY